MLDELTLQADEKEKLETIIKHRLTPQPVKIRAGIQRSSFRVDIIQYLLDIEVSCFGYEGIDAVKESLKAGLNQSTIDLPIKVLAMNLCFVFLNSL